MSTSLFEVFKKAEFSLLREFCERMHVMLTSKLCSSGAGFLAQWIAAEATLFTHDWTVGVSCIYEVQLIWTLSDIKYNRTFPWRDNNTDFCIDMIQV